MKKLISVEKNKVSIIGCGKVGMTAAYALLLKSVVNELVLISRSKTEIEAEQLDLEHGMNFLGAAKITASDDYSAIENSDVVVITAGAAQKPGETRLDLCAKNLIMIEKMIPEIVKHAPDYNFNCQ
jgi:L-lactate dehydrogenase